MHAALKEVAQLLERIGGPGSYATRRSSPPDDLGLEVRGIGRIRFPITPAAARKLCELARPARYGYKNETRLDRRVRDTWEIPGSRLSIDERRWARTLVPQLERIRCDLGLPGKCRLRADLHNLLVYGPGQFFAPHQDSEKADDMIGTLVVSLPSRFTGGAMVLEHQGQRMLVGGSARHLTLVAFYADCRHEVRPVKQGHRIALTYNLIAEGDGSAAPLPADRIESLNASVRRFFETPRPSHLAGGREQTPPDRLVYLLDHQYTQRALAWGRLKSSDAERAAALQEVAQRLDCEIFLALADVHETWLCEDEYDGYRGRRWSDYDENDDAEDEFEDGYASDGMPELMDLIDSDVELRHWVRSGSRPRGIPAGVGNDEICFTKPTRDFDPFESDYEPYTGNAGNTVDRWYHRAAVVLWPRERTFVIRAKASPRWAIGHVAQKLEAGHTSDALELAHRLTPFWCCCARLEDRKGLLEATLKLSAKLADPQTAAALLQPFTLLEITAKLAPRLPELLGRYGTEWCRSLLKQWTSERSVWETGDARPKWMGSALAPICRALGARDSSDGRTLAGEILIRQQTWLFRHVKLTLEMGSSDATIARALAALGRPILGLLEASRAVKRTEIEEEVVDLLTDETVEHAVHLQLGLLRAAHEHRRPGALSALEKVHARCIKDVVARLAEPNRGHDDWSIKDPLRCRCEICVVLSKFLATADKTRLEWPLAKEKRAHVHRTIDSRELPVRHETRRTGSPHTLVLEKTSALFQREAAARRMWQAELDWLTRTAADFRPPKVDR
jgi:2OG-Fe(II) oxygenase superfamily